MNLIIHKRIWVAVFLVFSIACTQKGENGSPVQKYQAATTTQSPPRPDYAVKAPDFKLLESVTGEIISMSSLRGKVVLLTFWGTWCAPCRIEIPEFIQLYNDHGKNGLEIVGITLPPSGTVNDIARFANEWKINYKVLADINGGETDRTSLLFGRAIGQPIYAVPTSFLIDREGYIVKGYIGPRTKDQFLKDLQPYL